MTAPQGRTAEKAEQEEVKRLTQAASKQDDEQMVIPDFEIEAMARVLLPALRAFYDSPEGQAMFATWKHQHENT